MLNSEKAILAMNDVDDSYLECARKMLGYKAEVKIRNTIKRRILTIALAATLILSLGIRAGSYADIVTGNCGICCEPLRIARTLCHLHPRGNARRGCRAYNPPGRGA